MAMNYDNIAFDSRLPAFRNKDSGSFTVSVSGAVGAGATVTWSGSTTFTGSNRMVRYSMSQNTVPITALYTSTDRVPVALMVGGSNLTPLLGCSGGGTDVAPNIYITSTATAGSAIVSVKNPYGSTITMTATILTFYYTAFEAFGES